MNVNDLLLHWSDEGVIDYDKAKESGSILYLYMVY